MMETQVEVVDEEDRGRVDVLGGALVLRVPGNTVTLRVTTEEQAVEVVHVPLLAVDHICNWLAMVALTTPWGRAVPDAAVMVMKDEAAIHLFEVELTGDDEGPLVRLHYVGGELLEKVDPDVLAAIRGGATHGVRSVGGARVIMAQRLRTGEDA